MKKWISLLLTVVLVLGMCPQAVQAVPTGRIVASGDCSDDESSVTWTLDDTGLLTISGTGWMENYADYYAAWHDLPVNRVVIEPGVLSISTGAFASSKYLTDVQISESVTYIGSSAFYNCQQLTRVELPDGLPWISKNTFRDCYNLVDVNFPAGLEGIDDHAFRNTGITNAVIPEGVESIGESAFQDCTDLASLTLPDSLTTIYSWAFWNCDSLERVEIPANVDTIVKQVFTECDSLQEIVVDDDNSEYSSGADNVLYNKDGTILIQVPGGITGEYTVADGVEIIHYDAFHCCRGITGVTMPEGVTTILHSAMAEMDELLWIKIPASVTQIDSRAFYYCDKLTDIYFGGTKDQWDQFPVDMYEGDVTIHYGSTEETIRPERPEIDGLVEQEWDLLARINRERYQAGVSALSMAEVHLQMADIRAEELAQRFGNTRPNGEDFDTVSDDVECGLFLAMQERIARDIESADAVAEKWLDSSSNIILNNVYRHAGMGYADISGDPDSPYWSMLLYQTDSRRCFINNFQVCVNTVTVEKGTDLGDLKLWATVNCLQCGTCYFPVLPEYYENYDSNTLGEQEVRVSDGTDWDTIRVIVVDSDAEEPEPAATTGDVNGDGKVNGIDAIVLRQYLASWDVQLSLEAADVNGDDKVNGLDAILLRQYLAGWNVELI